MYVFLDKHLICPSMLLFLIVVSFSFTSKAESGDESKLISRDITEHQQIKESGQDDMGPPAGSTFDRQQDSSINTQSSPMSKKRGLGKKKMKNRSNPWNGLQGGRD